MILSDFVSPDSAVARSVNLERDMGDEAALRQYLLTGKGLEIIDRLTSGLNGERVSAWSLTGPYGMGKSSFVNFLLALCGPGQKKETKIARKMLKNKDIQLHDKFQKILTKNRASAKGFFRVAATSSFEPINRTLADGLHRSIVKFHTGASAEKKFRGLFSDIEKSLRQEIIETQHLTMLFKKVGKLSGVPVTIFIDEFGKNLEFMARHPAHGDLYILQTLAETSNIFLWVCLHQAFDLYSSGLTSNQIREWGKIQGRFEDVSFVEPRRQMVRFIGKTLIRKGNVKSLNNSVNKWAKSFQNEISRSDLTELKFPEMENLTRFYPLHPLTAAILPELCVRFAQNDRTLFAFLCSGEPNALPRFLSTQTIMPGSGHLVTFGAEFLYDYFLSSANSVAMGRSESQRWVEIHSLIEQSKGLDPFCQRILKVIGLLNLISGPSGFRASERMLSFAFLNPLDSDVRDEDEDVRKALQVLIQKRILFYREYADEYRLWEGTDFDIPSAIRKRKASLAYESLDKVLEHAFPLTPLIASRHSYQTGTLRHFERHWCSSEQILKKIPKCSSDETDGLILYCFGRESGLEIPPDRTENGHPVVIAYSDCEEQIQEMILEAAASKLVLTDTPELERDGVARKEAGHTAHATEERLKKHLSDIFTPGNSDVTWYAAGRACELKSARNLSHLISELCDETYSKCPVIRNELINRKSLSPAASRARRELIEAMIINEAGENLGMTGTGPEVAIYRTMLLAEKIHSLGKDGRWQFVVPEKGSSYFKAWNLITKSVKKADNETIEVTQLTDALRHPPFGMKEGPIPVLICLFLIINSDELALYQEGAFIPYLASEEMELMVKRPEFFSIRRFAPIGIQGRIFQIYRNLLNTSPVPGDTPVRNATMVSVVGPLVQFVNSLPDYVRHSRALTREAQNVRHTLLQAKDPIRLLFTDIPNAIGLSPFDEQESVSEEDVKEFQVRFRTVLAELAQSYSGLIKSVKMVLTKTFGSGGSVRSLRAELRKRATPLIRKCGDKELSPFLGAIAGASGSDEDWIISVATIVSKRPVDSWRDNDIQVFSSRMHDFHKRFRALESVALAEKNKPPEVGKKKEARWVSVTLPDGKTSSDVIWTNKSKKRKLEKELAALKKRYSKEELEGLFAMLGEHLLKKTA